MSEADQLFPPAVGERLRAAREARGMSLDDVASRTRIPTRHLQHIENGEWGSLPATTYCVGFARSYANAVGLNGSAIGAELREQLGGGGGSRPAAAMPAYYEPADPARVPPRSLALIAGVIALLLAIGYMVWRSGAVDDSDVDPAAIAAAPPVAQTGAGSAPAAAPAQANGPVVLTAREEVWLRVTDAEGGTRLYENILKAGERYEVPATARAPQIMTGRPNALNVSVGATTIPPLGEPERRISGVSLLPADLLARAAPAASAPAGR
jgi:transcriptional regulator with XRE-family HTH domain